MRPNLPSLPAHAHFPTALPPLPLRAREDGALPPPLPPLRARKDSAISIHHTPLLTLPSFHSHLQRTVRGHDVNALGLYMEDRGVVDAGRR